MQENEKRESMERKLGEELKWYTLYASEEEYDWKAVESILYLLDRWEPLEEGTVPPVEESWKRFLTVAGKKELLPVEEAAVPDKPAAEKAAPKRKLTVEAAVKQKMLTEEADFLPVREREAGEGFLQEKETEGNQAMVKGTGAGQTVATEAEGGMLLIKDTKDSPVMVKEMEENLRSVKESEGSSASVKETVGSLKLMKETEGSSGSLKEAESSLRSVKETEGEQMVGKEEEYGTTSVKAPYDGLLSGEGAKEKVSVDAAENVPHVQVDGDEKADADVVKGQAGDKRAGKLMKFASRHKMIAAAVLVLMVLMVGNTIHAVANPEAGFFFWLERDDSGVKMMTSPEGLDDRTNKQENIFYNRDEAPDWAKNWFQIESEIEIEAHYAYELQYFEISDLENRQHAASHYFNEGLKNEVEVGVWIYWDKVSYFREEFVDYDYVQSYEVAQKEIDVYKKTEKTGQIYYIVCFYDENCQFYVRGQAKLDELKEIIEEYWNAVQENI